MRSASLKAGLGHNYLHGIIKDGKDPTVERLMKVCSALNVSPAYILLGDAPSEADDLLRLIQERPERLAAIVQLLRD